MFAVKSEYDKTYGSVLRIFPEHIRIPLELLPGNLWKHVNEIRLRAAAPIMVCIQGRYRYLHEFTDKACGPGNTVLQKDLRNVLEMATEHSVYTYQEDIKKGFITVKGGIRIGICGRVHMKNGEIVNIHEISSLNIRISREYPGCAVPLIKYIVDDNGNIANTLIVSPPMCGKTTILRDICRLLSDGYTPGPIPDGVNVGLVDERSEIASCLNGVPQKYVGKKTDILDDCPKVLGMNMIIRCMSPAVVITDEMGSEEDEQAVMNVLNAGVKIIASSHGYSMEDMHIKPGIEKLMKRKVFSRYIVLCNRNGPGTLKEVFDHTGFNRIYG